MGSLRRALRTALADRGVVVGAVALLVVTAVYPLLADATGHPLAVFALPPLLTAVLSGWRQTLAVGACSVAAAAAIGIAGPLEPPAVAARLTIITIAVAAGAIGARARERREVEVAELTASSTMNREFQRSLSPTLDAPRGFEVVVRREATASDMELGGDFIDVVELANGCLAVVIGDVCGHGPSEAAYGTALRAAWRTIVLTHRPEPEEWVRRLDAAFFSTTTQSTDDSTYVTVCTGLIDKGACTATLVSAGHPHPICIGPTAAALELPAGAPLGMGLDGWASATTAIGHRPLVFYTDGLVENPRRGGDADRWGEEGLLQWIASHASTHADLTRLGAELIRDALDGRQHRDDVAVMIVAICPSLNAAAASSPPG